MTNKSTFTKIKIPTSLIAPAIKKREIVDRYNSQRNFKAFGYYCVLKAFTTTGKIHNWQNQKKSLQQYLKLTRNSIEPVLKLMQEKGYIKICKKNIYLCSWRMVAQSYSIELDKNDFTTIYYDITDKKKTIKNYLYGIDINNIQKAQQKAIIKQLDYNPERKQTVKKLICQIRGISMNAVDELTSADLCKSIQIVQEHFYQHEGTEAFAAINFLRADFNTTVMNLRNRWELGDFRNIAYVKRKLNESGIAAVYKNPTLESNCNRIRYKQKVGKQNFFYPSGESFDAATKQRQWFRPDTIFLKIAFD